MKIRVLYTYSKTGQADQFLKFLGGKKKKKKEVGWVFLGFQDHFFHPPKILPHEKEEKREKIMPEPPNWSNAEGKGSMQHGEIIKVAYRAPAAQACNPPFP